MPEARVVAPRVYFTAHAGPEGARNLQLEVQGAGLLRGQSATAFRTFSENEARELVARMAAQIGLGVVRIVIPWATPEEAAQELTETNLRAITA